MAPATMEAAVFAQRVVIDVGDLAVSNNSQMVLSTYALGSCIGVVAYDPARKAGGMLHLMLPDSGIAPEKAAKQPALFADTGLALFFHALGGMRTDQASLQLLVAGGASILGGHDPFRIGERNTQVTLNFLSKRGYTVRHMHVGGGMNRTLHLDLSTGVVTLKTPVQETLFSLAA
jgi:chemotaxis protein CheD